jgi:hypothetical protein
MPDFIEGLDYVEEDCGTVLIVFQCLVYGVNDAMTLLCGGVSAAESELVIWGPA